MNEEQLKQRISDQNKFINQLHDDIMMLAKAYCDAVNTISKLKEELCQKNKTKIIKMKRKEE